ncbi:enoyl-CoA hydratase-related protein [Nevskia sp.]|uniref:enoyl-CoA hydratase-related protein n=1 Tax=Nevskia sp. TaxID=1929292 RepID=UPI0025F66CE5|nr:enoyl-CoA hydratase-related protein [Nevskia sp.]
MADADLLLTERIGRVALLRLNRPEAMNALSMPLREALRLALIALDDDDSIGAIVITGSDKVFAAGADVRALQDWSEEDARSNTELRGAWNQIGAMHKPVIAAVAGMAFGAGCELAMMCDFALAADNAQFGQPEIRLGLIPGSGGTQRLVRAVGKAKAMEMVLTGRAIDAVEAERCGLVSRVLPLAELIPEALKTAERIAGYSAPIVELARAAVNAAHETFLDEGLKHEATLFEATFTTEDRREGVAAFLDKRKPVFKNR